MSGNMYDKKMSKNSGGPSMDTGSYYSDDGRAKGFNEKGIPEKDPFHAQDGLAEEMTKVEKENLKLVDEKDYNG